MGCIVQFCSLVNTDWLAALELTYINNTVILYVLKISYTMQLFCPSNHALQYTFMDFLFPVSMNVFIIYLSAVNQIKGILNGQ